jgi:hypothetical protein
MGLFARNNKRGSNGRHGHRGEDNIVAGSKLNLHLYLSDIEWRVQFVLPDGTAASDPTSEAVIISNNSKNTFADTNEVIARALKEISNRQLRDIGTVSIVLVWPRGFRCKHRRPVRSGRIRICRCGCPAPLPWSAGPACR